MRVFSAIAMMALAAVAFAQVKSGLEVGAGVPAYNPQHVAGPLKGTNKCFV